MGVIVVGVDGSESSRAALEWALAEAVLRGSSLRAVHAWSIPAIGASEAPWSLMSTSDYMDLDPAELATAASEALEREIADAQGTTGSSIVIERAVVDAPPADAIVDSGKDAELIVVGSHGRGAVAALLLGSVSQHVAQHASCPVVIVRAPRD